jgi:hypothetical protein
MTREDIAQAVDKLAKKIEQSCFDADEVVLKLSWMLDEAEISHQAAKEKRP